MNSIRILLVDRHYEISNVHELLKDHGFLVDRVVSGYAALQKAGQYLPDAILIHMLLPDMDGPEVCRHLRAAGIYRHLPN